MRDINPGAGPERSIRSIPVPPNHRRAVLGEPQGYGGEHELPPRRARGSRRRGFLWLALALAALALVGGVLISTVFAGAKVTVTPKQAAVTVPPTLQAQLQAPVGTLAYSFVSETRAATTTVPATGTRQVSRQASGIITISNTFGAESQRLIANTRFEAPDGKIYRIRDSVTVPGMKGSALGTITATLYADSPGADYNRSSPTSFTIPGFKGDPRYTKFVAQSAGAISGGFIGAEPAVATADLTKAKAALQQQLDSDVRSAAASAVPEDAVIIPESLQVTYGELVQTPGESSTAVLTQTATLRVAMVGSADLASAVAKAQVEGYRGEAVTFSDLGDVALSVASSSVAAMAAGSPVTLGLTGSPVLVWQFDPNALKQALLGKPKSEFEKIVDSFAPAVEKAEASIRPFWTGSFPSDEKKVTVVVQKPR